MLLYFPLPQQQTKRNARKKKKKDKKQKDKKETLNLILFASQNSTRYSLFEFSKKRKRKMF